MIAVQPSEIFEATVVGYPAGLAGTIGVRILDNAGGTTLARTALGIIEDPPGSGSYSATALVAPTAIGRYSLLWDTGVVSPDTVAREDLIVTLAATPPDPDPDSYLPTVDDIGRLLRARTKDDNGNEVGTFNDHTRPTGEQVLAEIQFVASDILSQVGSIDIVALGSTARAAIALEAACRLEASYFPEQLKDDQSAYTQYNVLRQEKLKALFPVLVA